MAEKPTGTGGPKPAEARLPSVGAGWSTEPGGGSGEGPPEGKNQDASKSNTATAAGGGDTGDGGPDGGGDGVQSPALGTETLGG